MKIARNRGPEILPGMDEKECGENSGFAKLITMFCGVK